MSDCIPIHRGQISTWEAYPRVFYFRGRFLDLHKRFNRIIGALPETVRDKALMARLQKLNSLLEKEYINIIALGKESLTVDDLYVCKEKPNVNKTTNHDQASCLTLVICHATIDALDEAAVKEVVSVTQCLSCPCFKKRADSLDSVLIMCRIKAPFTEEESVTFRSEAHRQFQASAFTLGDKFDIQLVSGSSEFSARISAVYEKRVVDAFQCIFSYLSLFVTDRYRETQKKMNLLNDLSVVNTIREFLGNGLSMSDIEKNSFLAELTGRLVRDIKCSIISPMSSKYTLPLWLCNRLLHEIQFEEALSESVSENTRGYLSKFKRFYLPCNNITKAIGSGKQASSQKLTKALKGLSRDFIVGSIEKDFKDMLLRAERVMMSMEALTTVMRKLMFEISGYLKQTLAENVQTLQIQQTFKIPETLRQEIHAIQGVSGMGTIYGQLEIHINDDNLDSTAETQRRLKLVMKRHHFHHSYTIKSVKK